MHPSTIKQNYTLAKLLGIQVWQVMLVCLSSTVAWKLIAKLEDARNSNNQSIIDNIKNAIIYGTGTMGAVS